MLSDKNVTDVIFWPGYVAIQNALLVEFFTEKLSAYFHCKTYIY